MEAPVAWRLSEPAQSAVVALLASVRHDLGKYVALQVRALPADADDAELLAALRADVLATRRGPAGTSDAIELWDPFREALTGAREIADGVRVDLRGHPEYDRLAAALEALRAGLPSLRAGTAERHALLGLAAAARAASDAARALHLSVRG